MSGHVFIILSLEYHFLLRSSMNAFLYGLHLPFSIVPVSGAYYLRRPSRFTTGNAHSRNAVSISITLQ